MTHSGSSTWILDKAEGATLQAVRLEGGHIRRQVAAGGPVVHGGDYNLLVERLDCWGLSLWGSGPGLGPGSGP